MTGPDDLTTQEVIERMVIRHMRNAGKSPPACEIYRQAKLVAPAFDRIMAAGGTPVVTVRSRRGALRISVVPKR